MEEGGRRLHRNGIFGVAGNIPAGVVLRVREKRARTGDIFFGSHSVDLVFDFVALVGNGEKADVVNGRIGGAKAGNG